MCSLVYTHRLPWWLSGKESACNAGDLDSVPGLGRSPGEAKGYPLQYSGLENSMDCSLLGRTELDMTERLFLSFPFRSLVLNFTQGERESQTPVGICSPPKWPPWV